MKPFPKAGYLGPIRLYLPTQLHPFPLQIRQGKIIDLGAGLSERGEKENEGRRKGGNGSRYLFPYILLRKSE